MRFRAVLPIVLMITVAGLFGCGGGSGTTPVEQVGVIDDFNAAGSWVPGGTLTFGAQQVQNLVSTTLATITYDSGTTGAATITLASSTNVQPGMLLTFNPGGGNAEAAPVAAGSTTGTFRVTLNNNHAANEGVQDNAFAASVATGTGFVQSVTAYNLGVFGGAIVQPSNKLNLALRVDNAAAVSGGRVLLDIDRTTHDFAHTAFFATFTGTNLPLVSVNLGDLQLIGTNPFSSLADALTHVQGIRIELTTTAAVNTQIDALWLSGIPGSSASGVPAKVNVAPTSMSLNLGGVDSITAALVDANNSPVTNTSTFTYTTSNPALVTVSPSGQVCAGRWDSTFVNCTPESPTSVGTAQVVVANSGLHSDPVTVFVHPRVGSIKVTPATVNCRSQGQTQQMSAQAFDINGAAIAPELIGPFLWSLGNFNIATIDSTTNGLLTAKNPGTTPVFAQLGGANAITSSPATFITCPVQSITLHVADSAATSLTVDPTKSQAVVAQATDTQGNTLTSVNLTFTSSFPTVGSIQGSSFVGVAAGSTSTTAICAPPNCNTGFGAIYSNTLLARVTGDSATTVFVGGTGTTTLLPITTPSNALGTAITLAANPTSIARANAGSNLFLGSSAGLITVNMDANTASTNANVTGAVLTVSPDGATVVTSDVTAGKVFVTNSASSTTLNIAGATRAAYSPDSSRLFIITNTGELFIQSPSAPLRTIALGATARDVGVLASGWFTYLTEPGSIAVRATCDFSSQGTASGGASSPTLLLAKPDGTGMLAADAPSIDVVTANSSGAGCPPSGNSSVVAKNLGHGAFTPRQFFILTDGSKAYIITDDGRLLAYDVAAETASAISLGAGVNALSGGATLDSKTLYIGASDQKVHVIDVATATDKAQVTLTPAFTPDLLVVRAK